MNSQDSLSNEKRRKKNIGSTGNNFENQKDDYQPQTYQEQMNFEGEKPPVYLKNGPFPLRQCQDMFCIFISVICFAYYLMHLIYLTIDARPFNFLWTPYDPNGRPCGHEGFQDYHYIYFVTPVTGHLDRNVCVQQCPHAANANDLKNIKLDCLLNKIVTSCDANPSPNDLSQQVLIYNTASFGGNLCMPTDDTLYQNIYQATITSQFQEFFYCIQKSFPLLIVSAVLVFVFGIIFLGFINYCQGLITWIFLSFSILFIGLIGAICFLSAFHTHIPQTIFYLQHLFTVISQSDSVHDIADQLERGSVTHRTFFLTCAGLSWAICLIGIILIIVYLNKIRLVSKALQIAGSFVKHNYAINLVPLILFALFLVYFIAWLLQSMKILLTGKDISDNKLPFYIIQMDRGMEIQLLIHLLFLICVRGLLVSCGDFLITNSACLWYFSKSNDTGQSNVLYQTIQAKFHNFSILYSFSASLKQMFRYHLGTLMLHGFFTTFFTTSTNILDSIYFKLVWYQEREKNKCAHYIAVILLNCCCCFFHLFRFISKNSLIMVAMKGDNFYRSNIDTYYLIKRNRVRFETVTGLGGLFTSIGQIFLSLLSTLICYVALIRIPPFSEKVVNTLPVIICFLFISYTTASFFMDVYGVASDALILTTYIDEQVESTHFGRENVYNCPVQIRGALNDLRKQKAIIK